MFDCPLHNVVEPELQRDPAHNGPACWIRGVRATAQVRLWHPLNLTFATDGIVVRAETSGDYWNIADWQGMEAVRVPHDYAGDLTWPSDPIICQAEGNINDSVQRRDYTARLRYKVPWGMNQWIDMTEQSGCRLYVVLASPRAPQEIPWPQVLDISCQVTWGSDTETEAMDEIWDNFYNYAGGLYDVGRYKNGILVAGSGIYF
jgi:hypothetical protein